MGFEVQFVIWQIQWPTQSLDVSFIKPYLETASRSRTVHLATLKQLCQPFSSVHCIYSFLSVLLPQFTYKRYYNRGHGYP